MRRRDKETKKKHLHELPFKQFGKIGTASALSRIYLGIVPRDWGSNTVQCTVEYISRYIYIDQRFW